MKNYKTFYEKTILENIDFTGYDNLQKTDCNLTNIKQVYEIFLNEFGHEAKRQGNIKAFTEWLQGLPNVLTVPFYYYDILQNARKNFILNPKKENQFLNNYWENLSIAFFELLDNL